jgi:hypothetical protein
MNDKDKEAFEKWVEVAYSPTSSLAAWQAACEYKQDEINELIKDNKFQADVMCDMGEIVLENKKLQAETKKLREALKWYANLGLCDGYAKNLLKEVNEEL